MTPVSFVNFEELRLGGSVLIEPFNPAFFLLLVTVVDLASNTLWILIYKEKSYFTSSTLVKGVSGSGTQVV